MVIVPTPPNEEEKYSYLEQNKFWLYLGGLFSLSTLVTGMVLFSIQSKHFWIYILFPIMILFYLGLSYFIGIFGGKFKLTSRITITNNSIDVYLPSCGEERSIIANTLFYVSKLRWPKHLLNVYVLDDCKNSEHNRWLEEESKKYNYHYISRTNKGELKKAGNIRNAFALSKGDYFLILDADFVPREDMLEEMVSFMDKDTAIVQSPQFFRVLKEDSQVQKGAAYVQELFYRLIQVNRSRWNGSICVGTCALYKRSALAHRGGTAAIGYSEDVHTGFNAICDGYLIKYIPINLAAGVCPDTAIGYLVQQYRWATGSFSLFLNKEFWNAPIPKMTKMNYLSGMMYYITTGIGLFVTPLPSIIMLMFFREKIIYYNVLFTLPSMIYGTVALALWTKAPWGNYAMIGRHLSYYAHILAIYDKLRNQTIGWIPTGDKSLGTSSNAIYSRFKSLFYKWNLITLAISLSLSIFYILTETNYYHFIPTLLVNFLNLYIFYIIHKEID